MYQFLPDFLFGPRGDLSDDEEGKTLLWKNFVVEIRSISDDEEEENKREKKTRPTRHTDANRRRNIESSTTKPRQLAQEYQKPVRDPIDWFTSLLQRFLSSRMTCFTCSLSMITTTISFVFINYYVNDYWKCINNRCVWLNKKIVRNVIEQHHHLHRLFD